MCRYMYHDRSLKILLVEQLFLLKTCHQRNERMLLVVCWNYFIVPKLEWLDLNLTEDKKARAILPYRWCRSENDLTSVQINPFLVCVTSKHLEIPILDVFCHLRIYNKAGNRMSGLLWASVKVFQKKTPRLVDDLAVFHRCFDFLVPFDRILWNITMIIISILRNYKLYVCSSKHNQSNRHEDWKMDKTPKRDNAAPSLSGVHTGHFTRLILPDPLQSNRLASFTWSFHLLTGVCPLVWQVGFNHFQHHFRGGKLQQECSWSIRL